MRTEKALGPPLFGVSGGGEGDEGAGEKPWLKEVMGLGALPPLAGVSRQVLMCFCRAYKVRND